MLQQISPLLLNYLFYPYGLATSTQSFSSILMAGLEMKQS